MSPLIRWRLEPVLAEEDVTARVDSKAVVDVLRSIIAFRRQQSLLWPKQMLPRIQIRQILQAEVTQRLVHHPDPPLQAPSRLARIAEPRSRPYGGEMTLVTSYVTLVVCSGLSFCRSVKRQMTNMALHRIVLQAAQHPPSSSHEEARDQATQKDCTCRGWRLTGRTVCCELLTSTARFADACL
jgi:hypothetical protein